MWGLASTRISAGEHVTDMGAFRARVQLPVRERARTAFAELDVRAHVKRSARVERRYGGNALVDRGTALDDDRAHARTGQIQRGEQTRRPGSNDHRTRLAGSGEDRGRIGHGKRRARRVILHAHAAHGARLAPIAQLDRARHDEMDVALLPRIDAALERDDAPDRTQLHAEGARDLTTQHVAVLGQRRVQRHGNVRNLDHRAPPF